MVHEGARVLVTLHRVEPWRAELRTLSGRVERVTVVRRATSGEWIGRRPPSRQTVGYLVELDDGARRLVDPSDLTRLEEPPA